MATAFDDLHQHVLELPVFDTHEHLPHREDARETPTDFLREHLMNYLVNDLVSAGFPQAQVEEVRDITRPIADRWRQLAPFWELCRHTGYAQGLRRSCQIVHGIRELNAYTIEALNDSFQQTLRPGHFAHVLRNLCNIRVSVIDSHLGRDPELFKTVYRLDRFIMPRTNDQIAEIEADTGVRITCFDDWLDALEIDLDRAMEFGAIGLKCALAYMRPLHFAKTTRADAEREFLEILKHRHHPPWDLGTFASGTAFQDYMMHRALWLANRRGLTYQFHTGYFAGNNNYVAHGDPAGMANLFVDYPDVTFDLFHIAYPYQHVLSALGKQHPNVRLNMCWAHIISPVAAQRTLTEWLSAVPASKISAFGGDLSAIDEVVGHLSLARENVSRSLAALVDDGTMPTDRAKEIAGWLFWDNPNSMFPLAKGEEALRGEDGMH